MTLRCDETWIKRKLAVSGDKLNGVSKNVRETVAHWVGFQCAEGEESAFQIKLMI